MLESVLAAFEISPSALVSPIGSGLINHTWKVAVDGKDYVLQRINQNVFHHPEDIAANIGMLGAFLQEHHPDYLFTHPEKTATGEDIHHDPVEGYFRLFPFIHGSRTIDVVQNADQAYAAAREFGKFTAMLDRFPANDLKLTIPNFHNLTLRYEAFLKSLKDGIPERIAEAADAIKGLRAFDHVVDTFNRITKDPSFRIRVTHHDTKISNVLFGPQDAGLCVIDLDTVMPGYFISDVGDMMRTYLSPVSEEEPDLSRICIREDFFRAIRAGYGEQMQQTLTAKEKEYFRYAGEFMIYMQAIRFLTDHLCGDTYYGAKYPGHNLSRAMTQLVLLRELSALDHLR